MTSRPRLQAALWFFLLASLFMSPVLAGRTFYAADIRYSHPLWYDGEHRTRNYDLVDSFTLFYPNDKFYGEGFSQGRFRTWNPNILCGHPVYSSGGSGILYPPRLAAHLLLDTHHAHDLVLWLHLALSGFFMFSFLKRLNCSQTAALFGGTVWMFNGYTMTWFESEFTVCYGAVLPLILERLTRALDRRTVDWASAFTASIFMGLVCLAGHTQFWANTMLLSGFWTLSLCARHRHFRALPGLGLVMLLPIGVACVQLLPILDLASRTGRADREFALVIGAFRNVALSLPLTMVIPDILGTPLHDFALSYVSPRGNWLMLETCAYMGIATLPLLAYGLSARANPHRKFMAAAFVLLLLVPATPLFYPAYKFLPGFTKMASTRLLYLWILIGSVLSAFGLDRLRQAPARHWKLVSGLLAGLLLLTLGGLAVLQAQDWGETARWLVSQDHIRMPFREFSGSGGEFLQVVHARLNQFYRLSNPGFLVALVSLGLSALTFGLGAAKPQKAVWALLVLVALDLGFFGFRFNTTSPVKDLQAEPPAFTYIKEQPGLNRVLSLGTIRPNTAMPFQVATLGGQDALIADRVLGLLNALQNGDPTRTDQPFSQVAFPITNPASPLVHVAGANFVLAYPNRDLRPLGFEPVFQQPVQGMVVWRNPRAHPIVRMEPDSRQVDGLVEALSELSASVPGDRTVLVESKARQGESSKPPLVKAHRPGYWEIEAEGSGWLVLLQSHDPGWQATVDGEPTPIVVAQGAFQAVWIESGTHQVRLHYTPPKFQTGALISAGSILLLLLAIGTARRRHLE